MRNGASLSLLALCGLLGALAGSHAAGAETSVPAVQVTYLANEGFLLESGDTAVLVDALFGDGLPNYAVAPAAARADLEAARGRFSGIDLVLASHSHADHFDAAAVARHLRANPRAAFLSTPEAVTAVRAEMGDAAAGRELVAASPQTGASETHRVGGIEVVVLGLSHGRLPVQNLGLVVRLGGVEVLHVGDTSAAAGELEPYADELEPVDVWLLPDWLMGAHAWESARARAAGPTWLINMHLAVPGAPADWFGSAGSQAARVARVRGALPGVWVPVEPLASRRYPPP